MNTVEAELNSVKDLVRHVLSLYPETRDSDTLLYFKCCEYLGATNMEDIKKLNLSIISIHKLRQVVQNKEKVYMPSEEVRELRNKRRFAVRDYMARLSS